MTDPRGGAPPHARDCSGGPDLAVRIRLKKLGRRHRPFYRICAMDSRVPRDGRVIEELGTYDPMVEQKDQRVVLNVERAKYWVGVGALPTEKVQALLAKQGVLMPVKKPRPPKPKTKAKAEAE